MAGQTPPSANPALLDMLRESGELDRILDGRGLDFSSPPQPPPAAPPQPLYIPPADWDQEERDRRARERQAREAELQAALAERLESEREPSPYPATPTRRRFRRGKP